jgi:predicted component of type VI protein secretion system
MGVEKMSVSFELTLGDAVKKAAAKRSLSVSAWLAQAAQDRLRNEALGEALEAWERKFGKLTAEELAAAERVGRAAEPRRGTRRRAKPTGTR